MLLQSWAALPRTRSCARLRRARTLRRSASPVIADAVTPTARVKLDVVAWDRTAEFVCKYFQKGSLIAIDGRLQSRSYQDKNGNNRTAIEIVANNVNFAAPKSANAAPMGDAGYGAPTAAPAPRPSAQAAPAPSYSAGSNDDFALIEDEGDLPF